MKNPYGSTPYSTLSDHQLQVVADAQDNELAQELLTRLDSVRAELKEAYNEIQQLSEDDRWSEGYDEGLAERGRRVAEAYQAAIRIVLMKEHELDEEKVEEILDSIERKI